MIAKTIRAHFERFWISISLAVCPRFECSAPLQIGLLLVNFCIFGPFCPNYNCAQMSSLLSQNLQNRMQPSVLKENGLTEICTTSLETLYICHSVEKWQFYCHSDFTWNQFWRIYKFKICHFSSFIGSGFLIFVNFRL